MSRKRFSIRALLTIAFLTATTAFAASRYPAFGIVLKIQQPRSLVVSCAEIPHVMGEREVTLVVDDAASLASLRQGTMIDFTLVANPGAPAAEHIQIHHYMSPAAEPLAVNRMEMLTKMLAPDSGKDLVALGQPVPDFTLTNQYGQPVRLSQLAGKTVAITFLYTRCPFSDYCFRLNNNFGRVERRFADRMNNNLVLLSVSFDPQTDSPPVLLKYASTWKANTNGWYFLTGQLPAVQRVCHLFGMNVWNGEGMMAHSMHTAVIGQDGRLVANLEGNEFTAGQLGDLIQTVMDGPTR